MRCTVSVYARHIQDTRTGFTWTGAWIATILLALLFTVSLIAIEGGGAHVVDGVPASPGFTVGERLDGDPLCHQCR